VVCVPAVKRGLVETPGLLISADLRGGTAIGSYGCEGGQGSINLPSKGGTLRDHARTLAGCRSDSATGPYL